MVAGKGVGCTVPDLLLKGRLVCCDVVCDLCLHLLDMRWSNVNVDVAIVLIDILRHFTTPWDGTFVALFGNQHMVEMGKKRFASV